jgi:hypothetical protein
MFDGKVGSGRKVTYTSKKASTTKNKKDFVEDTKRLREARALERLRNISATKIQKTLRGGSSRSRLFHELRSAFDQKLVEIRRVSDALLQRNIVFNVPVDVLVSLLHSVLFLLAHGNHDKSRMGDKASDNSMCHRVIAIQKLLIDSLHRPAEAAVNVLYSIFIPSLSSSSSSDMHTQTAAAAHLAAAVCTPQQTTLYRLRALCAFSCSAFVRIAVHPDQAKKPTLETRTEKQTEADSDTAEETTLNMHVQFLKAVLAPVNAPSSPKGAVVAMCLSWLLCEELSLTMRQLMQCISTPPPTSSSSSTSEHVSTTHHTAQDMATLVAEALCLASACTSTTTSTTSATSADMDAIVTRQSHKLMTAIVCNILTIPAMERSHPLILQFYRKLTTSSSTFHWLWAIECAFANPTTSTTALPLSQHDRLHLLRNFTVNVVHKLLLPPTTGNGSSNTSNTSGVEASSAQCDLRSLLSFQGGADTNNSSSISNSNSSSSSPAPNPSGIFLSALSRMLCEEVSSDGSSQSQSQSLPLLDVLRMFELSSEGMETKGGKGSYTGGSSNSGTCTSVDSDTDDAYTPLPTSPSAMYVDWPEFNLLYHQASGSRKLEYRVACLQHLRQAVGEVEREREREKGDVLHLGRKIASSGSIGGSRGKEGQSQELLCRSALRDIVEVLVSPVVLGGLFDNIRQVAFFAETSSVNAGSERSVVQHSLSLLNLYASFLYAAPMGNDVELVVGAAMHSRGRAGDDDLPNKAFDTIAHTVLATLSFSRRERPLVGRLWAFISSTFGTVLDAFVSMDMSMLLGQEAFRQLAEKYDTSVKALYYSLQSTLFLFCSVFSHHLTAVDDEELLEQGRLLPLSAIKAVTSLLRTWLHKLYWSEPGLGDLENLGEELRHLGGDITKRVPLVTASTASQVFGAQPLSSATFMSQVVSTAIAPSSSSSSSSSGGSGGGSSRFSASSSSSATTSVAMLSTSPIALTQTLLAATKLFNQLCCRNESRGRGRVGSLSFTVNS